MDKLAEEIAIEKEYGAMLREDDLEPLALKLPYVWDQFYSEIVEFIGPMPR
jgi:hypothetical protein